MIPKIENVKLLINRFTKNKKENSVKAFVPDSLIPCNGNICHYEIKLKGDYENLKKAAAVIKNRYNYKNKKDEILENKEVFYHIGGGIYSCYILNIDTCKKTKTMHCFGECAFSIEECFMGGPGSNYNYLHFLVGKNCRSITLPNLCRMFNVSANIIGYETNIEIAQHIIINKKGEIIRNKTCNIKSVFEKFQLSINYYLGGNEEKLNLPQLIDKLWKL